MAEVRVVLVAEAKIAEGVRRSLLERSQLHVRTTASGIEGFNLIKYEHPELAFIDLALADVSGDELCRDVKADPSMKGTQVAMFIDKDDWFRDRAKDAGADFIIEKPFTIDDLEAVIAKTLNVPVRRAVRVPVRIKVDSATAKGEASGYTVDVSTSGVLFDMEKCELEKGFAIWLKFQLTADSPPITVKGEVARVAPMGTGYRIGVAFKSFHGESGPILKKTLRAMGA
jgi:DNA-binding response OmpR family regulator